MLNSTDVSPGLSTGSHLDWLAPTSDRSYITHIRAAGVGFTITSIEPSYTKGFPFKNTAGYEGLRRGSIAPLAHNLGLRVVAPFSAADTARAVAWLYVASVDRDALGRVPISGPLPETYEDFSAEERADFFRYQPAPLVDPREAGADESLVSQQWPLIEEVAFAEIVVFESSRPSGKSLAALAGGGAAGIVAAGAHDPLLLLYGFTSLVIVRVADPVLEALGKGLASKVRAWFEEEEDDS